ncbi:hypothetical protein K501DRAFT_194406, partial [Backusella circina FSU 941]
IVRTEEISDCTKDTVNEYLAKYKLTCSDVLLDNTLIKKVRECKDAACTSARLWSNKMDDVFSSLKPVVKENIKNVQKHANDVMENVKEQLQQLKVKGQWTSDKAKEILDKAHHEALSQKVITEKEWKKAYASLESLYKPVPWYQRFFRAKPTPAEKINAKIDAFSQTLSDHISHLGSLTKEQSQAITDQIRDSIDGTDFDKLTDNEWVDSLTNILEKNTRFNKKDLKNSIESLKSNYYEFKNDKLKYASKHHASKMHHKWDEAKEHASNLQHKWDDSKKQAQEHIYKWGDANKETKNLYNHYYQDSNTDTTDEVFLDEDILPSDYADHIQTVYPIDSKPANEQGLSPKSIRQPVDSSFASFWKEKEAAIYNKLGYTDTHIDWIKTYLERTFQNKKSPVCGNIDEAAIVIKRYLDNIKMESPCEIEKTVDILKSHLESWRTTCQYN